MLIRIFIWPDVIVFKDEVLKCAQIPPLEEHPRDFLLDRVLVPFVDDLLRHARISLGPSGSESVLSSVGDPLELSEGFLFARWAELLRDADVKAGTLLCTCVGAPTPRCECPAFTAGSCYEPGASAHCGPSRALSPRGS